MNETTFDHAGLAPARCSSFVRMSGAITTTAVSSAETPDQALARAQAAAQARRFGEAGGICNDVLATSPDNAASARPARHDRRPHQ